ncbi:MAG: hypothetical protein Q9175_002267 [Cornicularia normoerica]
MATPDIPEDSVNRFGLSQVHTSDGEGLVDVVFVHGLNGHPYHTWTSEKSKTFWPGQLLPPVFEEEKARILVYGYDADVTSFTDGVSKDKIHVHAEHLVAELYANRRRQKATERPIVFVSHSLGGLVVKRALIYSSEIRGSKTEHLRSIFISTYGILFLGTPHGGSDLAEWGSRLERICGAMLPTRLVDTQPQLVNALKTNSETLQNIDRQFIQLTSRFHMFFFHEAKPTNLNGALKYIVNEESASPNIQDVERASIQQDHSHMCKFENINAPGFHLVTEGIQRYASQALKIIGSRWILDEDEQKRRKEAEVEELLPSTLRRSEHTALSSSTLPGLWYSYE